jgi:hypothetical protein
MAIVFACAGSHAPGIRAWTERAPQQQIDNLFGGYGTVRDALAAARPEVVLLLTSEHWANFFEHIGAFCVGRGESFDGPVEPWLRVDNAKVKGHPEFATRLLEHCYGEGFELSYSHEMKLDHGSMVPLSFLTPQMDVSVVPIMFNALSTPRPSSARCLALGRALRSVPGSRAGTDRSCGDWRALARSRGAQPRHHRHRLRCPLHRRHDLCRS